MFDLKKLMALMAKSVEVMTDLQGKMETAKDATDDAAFEAAKTLLDAERETFEGLKAKAEDAKALVAAKKLVDEIDDLSQLDDDGKVIPVVVPAAAKDHGADIRAQVAIVGKYVQGTQLSGEERKAVTPTSAAILKGEGKDSVKLPDILACALLGKRYAKMFGKTMYSTSSPAAPNTNPSDAQNLVPPDFREQLLALPPDMAALLDRVTVTPSPTGTIDWPVLDQTDDNEYGGIVFQWKGEGAEKPETEPSFSQKQIQTHELCGYTEVSERLISRSAIDIVQLLSNLGRGALSYTLDRAIIRGSGAGQPAGIINEAGIRSIARLTAGTVTYQDLINLKHLVKPAHRSGAIFTLEDSVLQALEGLFDNEGRPLLMASVAGAPADRLIGYPYVVSTAPNQPVVGTSGDIIFGNPREYVLAMEEEITIARSNDYKFRDNLVAFKFFLVAGGRLLQPRAMSILDGDES